MLAADHIPQLCITGHARFRFIERCRWGLRRSPNAYVDDELRDMVAAASWRYGVPIWKVEELGVRRRRLPDPRWIVELIANTLPCHAEEWRWQRVAMVLKCDRDCWHVLTVLTGPPPRIAIDVFDPASRMR